MSKRFQMLSKEIEPGKVVVGGDNCAGGTCPAVLRDQDGSLVIVGNRLNVQDLNELQSGGAVKVYDHEFAIRINPELVKKIMNDI